MPFIRGDANCHMRSGISYRFAKSPRSTATKECHGPCCPNVQHFCSTLDQIGSKNSRTKPSRRCRKLFVQKDVWKVSFDMEDNLQLTHSGCLCKVNHVNAPPAHGAQNQRDFKLKLITNSTQNIHNLPAPPDSSNLTHLHTVLDV